MALTVGELTGYITIDDGQVRPALRRTEGDLRAAGQRMTGDADRSGQAAGQALGEGFVRASDGSIRDARGRFVQAGRTVGGAAGDALGDGLRQGADDGADDAAQAAEGGFSKIKLAAAAAGVAAGAVLMAGIGQALDQSRITGKLAAQLGTTPAVAQQYGKIAGQMYAAGVTEDFQGAADSISATMRAGLLPTGATNSQIKSIATNVSDLATTFELDLGQTANAIGQIMKTGLAPNAKMALDVITKGLQGMGPRADDIADTFNEYSVIFQRLGLNAQSATGLMSQGLKAGARDTDVVADALKEFTIEGVAGSDKIVSGFKNIGLNSSQMVQMISAGGPKATQALQMTLDKLRAMEDPVKRDAAATELFGTKSEDVQKALLALDPSKAVGALGNFSGAADKAGNSLRDNAGTRVEAFKRSLEQGVVNVLGSQVIPALMRFGTWAQQNSGTLQILAGVIGGALLPVLVLMGVTATVSAAQTVAAWVTSGASALASAGTQVAAGARVVGTWLLMGVQAMIQGARMAAAWVIAMGPIGWVIAAIVGLAALIYANWDRIKSATSAAWDWIWGKIKGIGKSIVTTILNFVFGALRAWDKLKIQIALKIVQLVTYVRGLPGRIKGAIGNLGSLLLEKGRNVVQGLWNGIKGMGGWIKGKLISWAKSMIPGPIAKALGIHSPSKVTTAQGRWIARGLIDGLTGSSKQVKAASTKLADMVTDGLRPGKKRSKALGKISSGSKKLITLATREAKIAGQLKAAQKKVADQIKDRDKLAADVRKGVLDAGNITSGGGISSAESILNNLTSRVAQAQQFARQLATLRKKGVRSDLIAQIAQAGVEQGAGSAAALANASASQVRQINSQQAALVKAADGAGKTAGDAMYGSGIQAARGLVKGLQSQQKAIERQMLTIAKGMQKAIRQALGIHSPSRVMAAVGRYIPQGLVRGIDGGRGAVDASMAALVDPSAVPVPAGSAAGGAVGTGAGGPARTVIEIRSSGSRRDDALLEELRHAIRVRGSDVQLVLAGKRVRR
ncbi:phage tail tape measure protein [Streptomyces sp. NBC_00984]|uniref:phage tail tape measure protein n=1 Tax=Streptomyces sp. NBC_00984 TaxID=2903700 RepID=UPI00386CFB96|nr:phage tail tape measure protein [Streptomyces sp. NBC_00984]